MRTFYSHRSGAETYQRCPRAAYLEYHHLGTGIQKAPRPLYFDVGLAVHKGLETLLISDDIEAAVAAGVKFYSESDQPFFWPEDTKEQLWLIECLLRGFGLFSWPAFKDAYEILFVEQEIEETYEFDLERIIPAVLNFSSRPDAVTIVRDRRTGENFGISWKTINDLTEHRRSKFAYDLQGFTEMYYTGQLFRQQGKAIEDEIEKLKASKMVKQLRDKMIANLQEEFKKMPSGVDAIQTVFFVKGLRKRAKADETDPHVNDTGVDEGKMIQDSFLTRPWRNTNTGQYAHAYRYQKPGNLTQSSLNKDWQRVMLFDMGTLPIHLEPKEWVEMLYKRQVFPSSDYQDILNPLASVIVFDTPAPRNEDMMLDVIDQIIEQEIQKCIDVVRVEQAANDDERKLLLNKHFPQHFSSCRQDFKCQFWPICHESNNQLSFDEIPPGFEMRIPHHEAELKAFKDAGLL